MHSIQTTPRSDAVERQQEDGPLDLPDTAPYQLQGPWDRPDTLYFWSGPYSSFAIIRQGLTLPAGYLRHEKGEMCTAYSRESYFQACKAQDRDTFWRSWEPDRSSPRNSADETASCSCERTGTAFATQ